MHQSSRAYELLRSPGCILLPSQHTLRDYTHHFSETTARWRGTRRKFTEGNRSSGKTLLELDDDEL